MIKELKELNRSNIKKITVEWFCAENYLDEEEQRYKNYLYDVDLSDNLLKINTEENILAFSIIDNDKRLGTVIRQDGNNLFIKSDQFDDGGEGVEYPIKMCVSENEIILFRSDETERQFIYIKLS